jgi:hypothetical protein
MTKPLDVNGTLLKVGDKVRQVEAVKTWGDRAIVRTVEAVATYEHLAGYVTVTGILGWCSAKRFEKVKP